MRKKQWMTSMIALSLTMGSMGMVFAADSAAPSDVKTISYGPIISITGSAAEQAHWIHSGWKQTVDVPAGENVVGNIVAYGNGNVYTINAPDSDFGVSKGEQQATFKIAIDTSKMNKNNFYEYPEDYGIDGQVLKGNLVIKAPIVAKAEMGGKMVLTGKDMHYNLLYSHLNQYLEDASKDENIKSTIEIHLTGDLIPGDDNNKVGTRQGDWLRQAGANIWPDQPGGTYYVGDILTNQDGSDGGEKGVIKIWANNITTRNVYSHGDSEIDLYAKDTLTSSKVWSVHDSKAEAIAPHIKIDEFKISEGNSHGVIGDTATKDITINNLKFFGGESTLNITGDTVTVQKNQLDPDSYWQVESDLLNTLTIQGKAVNWNGYTTMKNNKVSRKNKKQIPQNTFVNINATDTLNWNSTTDLINGSVSLQGHEVNMPSRFYMTGTAKGVDNGLTVNADQLNLQGDMRLTNTKGVLKGTDTVSLSTDLTLKDSELDVDGKNVQGKLKAISFYHEDKQSTKKDAPDASLRIHGDKGNLVVGNVQYAYGNYDMSITGLDDLEMKSALIDTYTPQGYGHYFKDTMNLEGKRIHFNGVEVTNPFWTDGKKTETSLDIGGNADVTIKAAESIILDKDIINAGNLSLNAPVIKGKSIRTGAPFSVGPYASEKAETKINADALEIDGAIGAMYPDRKVSINSNHITLKNDTASDGAGNLYASYGGELTVNVGDKGLLQGGATDNVPYVSEDTLKKNVNKASLLNVPNAKGVFDKIVADKNGTVNVNLGNEATWTVSKDSHVTNVTLQPKATIDLTGNDAPVSLVTNTLSAKDGIVDIGYTKNNHSMLTVTDSATGNVEVRVIPKTAEDLAVNVPKTQVVAVTNPKEGFKIKTVPYFEKGKIAGYTIPVTQEEGNGFIGGTFVKETNAMNPEAALNTYLGEQRRALVDHALLSTLPEEAYMPGVWASIGHGHYAGPYAGTHKDISIGYTKEVSPQWLVGGRILHENGDVDSVLENQAFTSKQRWTAGQVYGRYQQGNAYVKGDILVGNFKAGWDNDAIGKADASAQALHLEAGKAFKQGNWTVTPLVRLTLGRTPGYTAALSNGFTTRTDAGTLHFLQGGVRVEGQVSPSVSWNGRVLYGSGNRGAVNGVVTDGTDSIPWSVSGAGSLWDMSVGMTYQPRSTTTWGVSLGKMTGSGVREGWNWQVKGGFHF